VREVVLEMGRLGEAALDDLLSIDSLLTPAYRGSVYAAADTVR